MPSFSVVVAHSLDQDQAASKLRAHSEKSREEMGGEVSEVSEEWDSNGNLSFSFKAMGFRIEGTMVSSASDVTVSGSLPFAALPFRGMLETRFKERIVAALS